MHFRKKNLQFCLKFKRCKPHKVAFHSTKCGVLNDANIFPTMRVQFLTLSNQTKASALEFAVTFAENVQNNAEVIGHGTSLRE